MFKRRRSDAGSGRSFLARLARDKRGNTLMLVAAAIFPLVGMIGGAIDLSRLYLVKTRLQHACDAGALAGRKQMGGGAWTTSGTNSSNSVAQQLFNGNFPATAYGATGTTKSFTEANGNVNGTASATVPMTLMQVFHFPGKLLTVTCQAQEQVPNTDVMFVLDTTESMSEAPDGSGHLAIGATPGANSKIVNLKSAVKCFFEALRKLDTGDTSCDPVTGTVTTSRLRFGMVPYSVNVNISQLGLPDAYFTQKWDYQSRKWQSGQWRYTKVNFDVTGFKNSTTNITLPLGASGTNTTKPWNGCVEETAPLTDINTVPSTSGQNGRFAPAIPWAIYYRRYTGTDSSKLTNLNTADYDTTADLFNASTDPRYSNCPAAAYGLQTYADAATFSTRVNALRHGGNTRHDIGMLWGGRLLSPRGIKQTDNSTAPNGGPIFRHLIFMTDGDAKANECDYATYGVPWFDKREVSSGTTITNTYCNNLGQKNTTLTSGVESRLATLCSAVKAENNTILWVISFGGTGIDPATKAKLTTCATDGNHFFDATDNSGLRRAFQQIAAQISQLRIVQ